VLKLAGIGKRNKMIIDLLEKTECSLEGNGGTLNIL
jgi:hypothetical protein